MKSSLLILMSLFVMLGLLTGCNNQENAQTESQESFETRICENTYSTSILGYDVSGKLNQDGTGKVEVNGREYNFKYTLSNPTDDSATITINDTGINDIDGKSAEVKLEGDDLVVTYGGMSYTVKADQEKK